MVHIKLCVSSNVVFGLFLLSNIAIHKSATWLEWDSRPKDRNQKKKNNKPEYQIKSGIANGKISRKKMIRKKTEN